MTIYVRAAIVVSLSTLFMAPGILIYFLNYQPAVEWNSEAVKTNCTVVDWKITQSSGGYKCDGQPITCYYDSYMGYAITQHGGSFNTSYFYGSNHNVTDLQMQLQHYLPIGSDITCWYSRIKPRDVRFERKNTKTPLASMVFFFTTATLFLFLWMAWEVVQVRKRCYYTRI